MEVSKLSCSCWMVFWDFFGTCSLPFCVKNNYVFLVYRTQTLLHVNSSVFCVISGCLCYSLLKTFASLSCERCFSIHHMILSNINLYNELCFNDIWWWVRDHFLRSKGIQAAVMVKNHWSRLWNSPSLQSIGYLDLFCQGRLVTIWRLHLVPGLREYEALPTIYDLGLTLSTQKKKMLMKSS
jgi:hypothetical protein